MDKKSYDELAEFYDQFQSEEDPDVWAEFLDLTYRQSALPRSLREGQGQDGLGLALDLGCGTGLISLALARRGWDVLGIDLSENMLGQAQEHLGDPVNESLAARPLFLCQDIRNFELYGTVNFIYATLDTLNHLDFDDLKKCLSLCKNYLHPGGVLVFDLLKYDYMKEEMGKEVYFDVQADYAVLWSNAFDEAAQRNQADLTIFSASAEDPALYERYEDEIIEYYHDGRKVGQLLEELGFRVFEPCDNKGMVPDANPARRDYFFAVQPDPLSDSSKIKSEEE